VTRRVRAVRTVVAAALVLAGLLLPAGCSAATSGVRPGVGLGATGRLTVIATPPLVDVLARLGKDFQTANPTLTFAVRPAPATGAGPTSAGPTGAELTGGDVLALDEPAIAALGAQLAGSPLPFAANQLVIAVAAGNPLQIAGLVDLSRPGLRLAVCAAAQPCGAAAVAVLGGQPAPTRLADDASAAIADVRAGRADAALVYRTDARAAKDDVDTVEFPQSRRAVAHYQLATLRQAANPDAAARLLAFLTSSYASDVLSAAGFQPA
jgi:molybdate transport system substrate-binding protein